MPQAFGKKLQTLRKLSGMTQAELAQRLSLTTQSHVSYLESGKSEPSLVLAVRAAAIFWVSLDYLLRDSTPIHQIVRGTAIDDSIDTLAQRFGTQLRWYRQHHALSQTDLAEKLALVTQAYVSLLEAGRKLPSPEMALRCADLFEVSVDALFAECTSPE